MTRKHSNHRLQCGVGAGRRKASRRDQIRWRRLIFFLTFGGVRAQHAHHWGRQTPVRVFVFGQSVPPLSPDLSAVAARVVRLRSLNDMLQYGQRGAVDFDCRSLLLVLTRCDPDLSYVKRTQEISPFGTFPFSSFPYFSPMLWNAAHRHLTARMATTSEVPSVVLRPHCGVRTVLAGLTAVFLKGRRLRGGM